MARVAGVKSHFSIVNFSVVSREKWGQIVPGDGSACVCGWPYPCPHDEGHHKDELSEEKAQALGSGRFRCFELGGYFLDTCMRMFPDVFCPLVELLVAAPARGCIM